MASSATPPSAAPAPPAKNYEAAFGALSSSYGFGGVSPSKTPKKTPKKKKDDAKATPSTSGTPAAQAEGTSKSGQNGPKK
ncbi:hypothetical protein C2E23DRAFT_905244 [Lenzites betulinus]|nr:hypothetical protein C2E23DRAFT_905244 [Lenzites betulinus]